MWYRSLVDHFKPPVRRRPARKASRQPEVEQLEDRTVPSFLAPVDYSVGNTPARVVAADVNGDGISDLVVANQVSSDVSVLLGKRDGTFQAAQNYAVGNTPESLAVGDFNADGKLDIVTANADGSVSVLLGNGDGTFQSALNATLPTELGLTQTPLSVAVGDFNKDGKLDLAVTANTYTPGTPGYCNYYGCSPGTPGFYTGYVNVLIGNGAGGFTPANTYTLTGGSPESVAVGDFNGDGSPDLAVTESDVNTVSVILGNGDGSFGNPTDFAVGTSPISVTVGDFNGDGKLDIATASAGSSAVSVLLGNGNGTFGTAAEYATNAGPYAVAAADFNGDGKVDLVTADYNANSVSVILGNGDGTFRPAQTFAAGTLPASLAVGDFNSDGLPDVAVVNNVTAGTVGVLLNTGDWRTLGVSGFPSSTTAGTAGSFTVTAYKNDFSIDIGYTGTVHFTSSDPQAVLPADYNFTVADAGVHTFSATLETAGTQSITSTDTTTASLTATDSGITVNPAAASTLSLAGFASPITAGVGSIFTATLHDPYGNIATGYTGTVHFTSSDGQAVLPADYTFTASDAGVHTFSATLKTAGTQSITAIDTTNASLTGTDSGIAVNPAAASQFVISAPTSVFAGVPFSLTVTVEDAYGNVATGYRGTVHLSSSVKRLSGNYTFTAADAGVHTFTGLVLSRTGNQTITITDTLNSALTDSVIVDVLKKKR
jgi:hypothetical protein